MAITSKLGNLGKNSTVFLVKDKSMRLCPVCLNNFTQLSACDDCKHTFGQSLQHVNVSEQLHLEDSDEIQCVECVHCGSSDESQLFNTIHGLLCNDCIQGGK
ncbi:hypothetical protein DLR60_16975 [Vibrio tarriae]|uniref:hypothetical protein n=1 Tax=Vibrio tarriae TaxID=2014742 RepID=UPI000DE568C7|nr:hypothetical protein [Vibrio tarriae]RBM66403.1 hypothetical protein DLR60_16975 [Vibrio tarriae]